MKVTTKVSISLPEDLARFVSEYQTRHKLASRSAVLIEAVRLLRERAEAYKSASEEWDGSEDVRLWDKTVGDGL